MHPCCLRIKKKSLEGKSSLKYQAHLREFPFYPEFSPVLAIFTYLSWSLQILLFYSGSLVYSMGNLVGSSLVYQYQNPKVSLLQYHKCFKL